MVRKRKKKEEDEQQPPWCYYCDRVFFDEQTLVQHQKAKHFKCTVCHKRLTSAGGLRVHCHQVHRFALEKVPFAKPGKESMDLEVFGMAGVPAGAMPGDLPPEAEEESAAKALKALPAPPAPLPPLGSQMPGGPPPPVQAHSQQHYMPPPMQAPYPMMPQHPAPQFAPPPFLGAMPPFLRPPLGIAPPPGFPVLNMPQPPAPGSFQPQMPPVFPAGAGLRAQGQPVFPIGQAAAPGASDAPRFAPAALPNSAPATQVQDPNFNASGPPHMMSQPTQTQPVFPIGQAAAPGGPDAPRFAPAAFQSSATVMQAQAPNFNASGPPHMMQQPAQTQPVFPIGQAAVPAAFQSAPPMQPETTGSFANGPLQMPLQPQYMPSPAAGFGTPNDSMQSMHATPQHAPALDSSNPAVIWKAIDVSMEESRAQDPKYQQRMSRAAGFL